MNESLITILMWLAWLKHVLRLMNLLCLFEASPPSYTNDHIPRASRKGGGVANIYNSKFQFTKDNDCVFVFWASSHEIYAAYSITFYSYCLQHSSLSTLNSYRTFVVMANNITIFGDFNIDVKKSTDPLQKAFGAIMSNMSPDLLTATVILWT